MLIDRFGRVHTDLRISVTDRCNIRCFYCMPAEEVVFRPRYEILTFEEIERFVRVVAELGVDKLRLTGGEPLVRQDLPQLVRRLAAVEGIRDIALTTNGMLLARHAPALKAAGLQRLNISLDTLSEQTFQKISRREGLDQVLEGIFAARQAGFGKIRLNALAIRDLTEEEIVPLARFARDHGLEIRFIEFMPLDADNGWQRRRVLSGREVRRRLEAEFGPLLRDDTADPSQPAVDYRFADGLGRVGFINPVSEPFCGSCNRLRLTAEGQVRNCLFSTEEWDARAILRGNDSAQNGASAQDGASAQNGASAQIDQLLSDLVHAAVGAKKFGHGIDTDDFVKPARAMYQIGG